MIFGAWLMQSRLRKALDLINCGIFASAAAELNRILRTLNDGKRRNPFKEDILFYLAECYLAMGDEKNDACDFAGALQEYQRAVELDIHYPDLFFRIGSTCFKLDDLSRARENLERALSMNIRYLNAHILLAMVYARLGEEEKAIREYRTAREQGAVCDTRLFGEALGIIRKGERKRGLELLQTLFQEKTDPVKNLTRRGVDDLRNHEYTRAIGTFREALRRYPDFPDLLNLLGVAHCGAGHYPEAETAFRRSMDLNPGYLDPRLNLAFLYIQWEECEKAEKEFLEVLSICPGHVIATEGLTHLKGEGNAPSVSEGTEGV